MADLFDAAGLSGGAPQPLADALRPKTLGEVVGQDHLLGPEGPLGRALAAGRLPSIILWGPPGVGKTTIARLLAEACGLEFEQLSAVFAGVADLRKAIERAKAARAVGRGVVLFVDEIHRFNTAQQDGFLPHVEDGLITLIGATTENPSFELNAALLSRAQVLTLNRLDQAALETLLARAEAHRGRALPLTGEARAALVAMADGDGRFALNLAEAAFDAGAEGEPALTAEAFAARVARRAPVYDKTGEGHYNLISALHKSVRGSDADAALYWLARMLAAGEDPLYVARRLVRMAVEDVGLADPQALSVALAAKDAFHFLGAPEGELALAQCALYLATAPKSNAAYAAFKGAAQDAREAGSLPPPPHAVNAPTRLMRALGYGAGYEYDHDADGAFAGLDYFPSEMARRTYYRPTSRGFEAEISRRMATWTERRRPGPGEPDKGV